MPVDSPVGYFGIGFLTIKPRSGLTVHHVKPDSQRIELDSQGCHLFVILAPELFHHDTGLICNCTSWQSRGWCISELLCQQLSSKPDTTIITLHSAKHVELSSYKIDWDAVWQSQFTVED